MTSSDRENLKDQLRATIAGRADGIDLDTPQHWAISDLREPDAPRFFELCVQLLPPDSILYFEGTSIAPDIAAFYNQHRAPNAISVIRDALFPIPETFHVTCSPIVIARLRELSQSRPLTELCDHIKAFCDAFGIQYSFEQTRPRKWAELQTFLNLLEDPNAMRKIRFAGEPCWRTCWRTCWRRLTGR